MPWNFCTVGMGMYSGKGSSLEHLIFVHYIWNAVSWSQLNGLLTSRKLCKWAGGFNTYIWHLWHYCWCRYISQGTAHYHVKLLCLCHYTILDSHIKNLDTSRSLDCLFSMLFRNTLKEAKLQTLLRKILV